MGAIDSLRRSRSRTSTFAGTGSSSVGRDSDHFVGMEGIDVTRARASSIGTGLGLDVLSSHSLAQVTQAAQGEGENMDEKDRGAGTNLTNLGLLSTRDTDNDNSNSTDLRSANRDRIDSDRSSAKKTIRNTNGSSGGGGAGRSGRSGRSGSRSSADSGSARGKKARNDFENNSDQDDGADSVHSTHDSTTVLNSGLATSTYDINDGSSNGEAATAAAAADSKNQFKKETVRTQETTSSDSQAMKLNYDPAFNETQMRSQQKSHIKHGFFETTSSGNIKFICYTFWATQFRAIRSTYFNQADDDFYIHSLSESLAWNVTAGKSGANFSKTVDGRFVIKCINSTELQMFNDFAPAYFEYQAKNYFEGLPSVLCKLLGVYRVGFHNISTGKKTMEQVVVMENLFYERCASFVFDLKGSAKERYVATESMESVDDTLKRRRDARRDGKVPPAEVDLPVMMDDNLMEITKGRPYPLKHKAKVFLSTAVYNDTLFLGITNIVDYSIVVGFDEKNYQIFVGIIDYLHQYDFMKRFERMGKSVGMIAGQAEPTIVQPSQYQRRFRTAIDRYFMTVPDQWTSQGF